jgi:hypothetical protein
MGRNEVVERHVIRKNADMSILLLVAPALAHAMSPYASAQEANERADDLIHADLPLFLHDDEKYPKYVSDGEGDNWSFGCATRVRWGDWKFSDPQDAEAEHWYRFTNYGVFHCYAMTTDAHERTELKEGLVEYSFFVPIGTTRVGERMVELWAIQSGSRPGSSYRLLAREPDGKMITRFTMLQQNCPGHAVREAGNLDISGTRYCAINSRLELFNLAEAMAQLPPLGMIEHVGGPIDPAD